MKKAVKIILTTLLVIVLIPVVFLGALYAAISVMTTSGLTSRDAVVRMYVKNEEAFLNAAATGDFSALGEIRGVEKVHVDKECVDFQCGGSGFGSNTQYYGIFYSKADNKCAVVGGSFLKLEPENNGYRWKESDGDNEYYVEPLGNHFFYYEEKY